jgi:hypothetical protein
VYFTLFPPINIVGSAGKTFDIPGLETLKSVSLSDGKLRAVLEIDGERKTFEIISFDDPSQDVHNRVEPDDDFPLELMPLLTIEFFEEIAKLIEGYTIISTDPPETGYLEVLRGDRYPISIRGADKHLYPTTAELRSLRKDYIVALKGLLQVDFEEHLGNALATFIDNVLQPMSETMEQVYSLDNELENEESIVNIIGGDFKRLISRTRELITIVNYNMEQTSERNKAFLRLTLPLMLKQALLENFTEYFEIEIGVNSLKLSIKKRKTLNAEDLIEIVQQSFR